MTVKELKEMSKFINLYAICEAAGLKPNTIWQKMARGSELSPDQVEAIIRVIKKEILSRI